MENFPRKGGQLGSEAAIFFLLVSACFAFNLIKYMVQISLRAFKEVFYFVYSLCSAAPPFQAGPILVFDTHSLPLESASTVSHGRCLRGQKLLVRTGLTSVPF